MSVPTRLVLFALLLAAVGGGAALAGAAIDPGMSVDETGSHVAEGATQHGGEQAAGHGDTQGAATTPAVLPGLAAEQDGLRLALTSTRITPGRSREVRFRIIGADGVSVRRYDVVHEKRLHLIVVRRDLRSFEHLHPTLGARGVWSAQVDLRRAGTYRVLADFTVDGVKRTLGGDVQVPGRYDPRRLPGVAATVRDDHGLDVRLRRRGDRVSFQVRARGELVNDRLQPYLGAKGHLVSLRVSDLAYLHTHPEGDALAFAVSVPSSGRYRRYVQFRLDGRIHTAAFTEEIAR